MEPFYSYKVKSALHHHNRKDLPYSTDLNPYTGCSHRCIYCYAAAKRIQRTGKEHRTTGFKENVAELLEKELYSRDWTDRIINIGGATDAYQECEKNTAVMRDILKLLIRFKVPVIISTKSDLITRDIDLIKELSEITYVNIAFSLSTLDPGHSGLFEPGTCHPENRIKALKMFSGEGINSALHFFPVIPFVSDTEMMTEAVAAAAAGSSCRYMIPGMLYLSGNIREVFFSKLSANNPGLTEKILSVYEKGGVKKEVKYRFYSTLRKYTEKYRVETDYRKFIPASLSNPVKKNKKEDSGSQGQLDFRF